MLKTNQIPNFKEEKIFEFSHIDSLEENKNLILFVRFSFLSNFSKNFNIFFF